VADEVSHKPLENRWFFIIAAQADFVPFESHTGLRPRLVPATTDL